ncbi:Bik1 protein [Saccharomycopsis crataegensis]|uniref:Bik1 protein n=1 Tax=Saccharomycopsis crataegensis TaxID=43959 RepID=A0AAV5QRY8_9ASCO|nr:Bik1 protein [Saccharomycopsis crataegensis]
MSSTSRRSLEVGATVLVPHDRVGILRFIGNVDEKPGLFAGIELINGSPGRNNGDYKGKKYFDVEVPNSGLFYSYDSIATLNVGSATGGVSKPSAFAANHNNNNNNNNKRVSTGTFVTTAKGTKAVRDKRLSLDSQATVKGNTRRSFTATLATTTTDSRTHNHHHHHPFTTTTTTTRRTSLTPIRSGISSTNDLASQIDILTRQQDALKQEKMQLASDLSQYKAQLDNKVSLLQEYENSIEEILKPTIEDYKYQLQQKDTKISKLKQQADQQRDELRDAISALEDQASENAEIYTTEITSLKKTIAENEQIIESLSQKTTTTDQPEIITTLKAEIQEKTELITSLKDQIRVKETMIASSIKQDPIVTNDDVENFSVVNNGIDSAEFEAMKVEFEKIKVESKKLMEEIVKKDISIQTLSDEIALLKNEHNVKTTIETKSTQINELQIKDQQSLDSNNEKLESLKETYKSQISDKNLEISKLNEMVADLSLQQGMSSEVQELKTMLVVKEQEIFKLQEDNMKISKLNADIGDLKKRNLELIERSNEAEALRSQLNNNDPQELIKKDVEIEKLKHNIQVIDELNGKIEKLQNDNSLLTNSEANILRQYEDLRYRHSETEVDLVKKNQVIDQLKSDILELRTTNDELLKENEQLKSESELLEELQKEEMLEKSNKIEMLLERIKELESSNNKQFSSQKSPINNNSLSSIDTGNIIFSPDSDTKRLSNTSSIVGDDQWENSNVKSAGKPKQLRYSSTPEIIQGELPIYKPKGNFDASAGRSKWCGLCEREGHDSYECPYET